MKDVIKLEFRTVGGKMILDLRHCLVTDSGGIVPTKRGFSIPVDSTQELVRRLQHLNGKAEFLRSQQIDNWPSVYSLPNTT